MLAAGVLDAGRLCAVLYMRKMSQLRQLCNLSPSARQLTPSVTVCVCDWCCQQEGLVLMADEVYQTNIYAEGKSFLSFKKVSPGDSMARCEVCVLRRLPSCVHCDGCVLAWHLPLAGPSSRCFLLLLAAPATRNIIQHHLRALTPPTHTPSQVLMEMGDDCTTSVPLVSMNSISKGFFGECGRWGGVGWQGASVAA